MKNLIVMKLSLFLLFSIANTNGFHHFPLNSRHSIRGSQLKLLSTLTSNSNELAVPLKKLLENAIEKVKTSVPLKSHPGFCFGLACDSWEASDFKGSIEGWSGEPKISWVASSIFESTDDTKPFAQADFNIFVTPNYEVPHLKMTVISQPQGYSLLLDNVPREDMIASLNHYDKFYKGLDDWILDAERNSLTVAVPPSPPLFLTRILTSPYALRIDVKPEGTEWVTSLCAQHIDRWCNWINTVPAVERRQRGALFARDNSLHKLRFQEGKFVLASVLNPDFAPKAAELSAAMIGPGDEAYIGQGS